MIRNTIKLATVVASMTFGAQALAQVVENTTATATIEKAPVSVTENTGLAFGSVIKPTSGTSTVSVDATGASCARSITGGNGTIDTGSAFSCATYTVTGETGQVVNVTFDAATFSMTGSTGSTPLTVTLNKSANPTIAANTAAFKVGGSFAVGTATAAATYTGTFNVNVAYQ